MRARSRAGDEGTELRLSGLKPRWLRFGLRGEKLSGGSPESGGEGGVRHRWRRRWFTDAEGEANVATLGYMNEGRGGWWMESRRGLMAGGAGRAAQYWW